MNNKTDNDNADKGNDGQRSASRKIKTIVVPGKHLEIRKWHKERLRKVKNWKGSKKRAKIKKRLAKINVSHFVLGKKKNTKKIKMIKLDPKATGQDGALQMGIKK